MRTFLQNKTFLLLLCGFGAAVCFAVGAASKPRQRGVSARNDHDTAASSGGYGQNDSAANSKCCDKPPSKSALLQAK